MSSLIAYSLVAVGGSLGAVARFALANWIAPLAQTSFPVATFLINVSGSFLLGIVGTVAASNVFPNSDAIRLALGVGFLGGYTTFSTFEYETQLLLDNGAWLAAAAYVAGSVFVGLIAVRAGISLTRAWLL